MPSIWSIYDGPNDLTSWQSAHYAATRAVGFDDQFQYEDFGRPLSERRIKIEQLRPDLGAAVYQEYLATPDRHPY